MRLRILGLSGWAGLTAGGLLRSWSSAGPLGPRLRLSAEPPGRHGSPSAGGLRWRRRRHGTVDDGCPPPTPPTTTAATVTSATATTTGSTTVAATSATSAAPTTAPPTTATSPGVVQLGDGLVEAMSPDASNVMVSRVVEGVSVPGCEGQPEPVLVLVPVAGGPAVPALPDTPEYNGSVTELALGRVALVAGCEEFLSGIVVADQAATGRSPAPPRCPVRAASRSTPSSTSAPATRPRWWRSAAGSARPGTRRPSSASIWPPA